MENYQGLDLKEVKQAVANYCSFDLSIKLINELEPNFDILLSERELKRSKEVLKAYNTYGGIGFSGLRDLNALLTSISKGQLCAPIDLYYLYELMKLCNKTNKYRQELDKEYEMLVDLLDGITNYQKESKAIEKCINSDYEIKDEASSELKHLRNKSQAIEKSINAKTSELIKKYHDSLMDNITAFRNNRTCLLVKTSDKHKIKGFIHDESSSGQAVYLEPEALLNLNNELNSVKANIKEEENRIIRELLTLVEPKIVNLKYDLQTLTLLDSYFARAKYANDVGGVYADFSENDELALIDARHPLIDPEKVVANSYRIINPYKHLLISGSNTGGKTVSLKTIGLFTVLTNCALPLTCTSAVIPHFNNVFVDVGDNQSILESLSTFSAHLTNLKEILDAASKDSLVLIDELGSGTDPSEGECLAIAVLKYLQRNNITSVATTHYSKVKEYAKSQNDILLASVAFDLEKMVPTYKYLEGFAGNSNAIEIASRYGLKQEVIDEANILKESSNSDTAKLIEKLEKEKIDLLNKQEQLSIEKQKLNDKQKELDQVLKEVKNNEQAIIEAAKLKSEKLLKRKRDEIDQVIDELKKKDRIKPHEEIKAKMVLNDEEEVDSEIVKKDYKFSVGDYVSVDGLKYHGEIESIKGKKASVKCNGLKMNVELSRLTLMPRPKKVNTSSVSASVSHKRVGSECNVIGQRVEEALVNVDNYLDDCLFNKRTTFRIVHGAGTGALRKAIHEYLNKSKYVKEYRLGGEGEGGLGATVVTLKSKNG